MLKSIFVMTTGIFSSLTFKLLSKHLHSFILSLPKEILQREFLKN